MLLDPVGIEEANSKLIFYFNSLKRLEVESAIHGLDYRLSLISFDFSTLTPRSTEVIKIGLRARIRIVSNDELKKRWAREVIILRGSAFGTGDHPTTRRMLSILSRLPKFCNCLDFGAGTGILGLLFERMTRGKVFFVENDPLAVENLRFNLKVNRSRGFIVSLTEAPKVDLILANVYFSTILNNLNMLLSKRPKMIILSGLRETDDLGLLEGKVNVNRVYVDDGWVSCIVTPKQVS